jgi:hypothetical protein
LGSGIILTDALDIVSEDKQAQNQFMIEIALGKRQGLAHESREALPEEIVPALHVIRLVALFAHGVMFAGHKDFGETAITERRLISQMLPLP